MEKHDFSGKSDHDLLIMIAEKVNTLDRWSTNHSAMHMRYSIMLMGVFLAAVGTIVVKLLLT